MNKGYKQRHESQIPWLGALPAHWKPAKLKYIAEIVNGATPDSGNDAYWDGDISWITPTDLGKLNSAYVTDSKRKITDAGFKSCGTSMVPAGTVIMTTRAPIGNSCIVNMDTCFNQGCKALLLREGNNKFMYYQLVGYRPYLEMLGSGSTFMELSTDKFKDFVFPVPPLTEQRAIVAYLDHKTEQLDRLLGQKEMQLELLHQKRQTLINEAITQGLNHKAPRKSSGVAWLGDVPSHWHVNRLSYASDVSYGITLQLEKGKTDGMKIITVRNITTDGQIVLDEQNYIDTHLVAEEDILQPGDILFNWRNGSATHVGKTAIFNLEGTYTHVSFLLRIRAKDGITPAYLANFLGFLRSSGFFGASKDQVNKTFNASELKQMPIIVPPLEEQIEIDKAIVQRTLGFKKVQELLDTQIQTLKAYRQSLISEVVTGKVDVRTAVSVAPESDLPLWMQ